MQTSAKLLLAATLAPIAAAASPSFAQSVPGFTVSTYANPTHPVLLSFGPDGTLFAGRDPVATGSTTPVKPTRIGPGGSPVASMGAVNIPDPDTVLLDVTGSISGVAGTLLVGGLLDGSSTSGQISGIRPDDSVVQVFAGGPWANPVEMKFDAEGRLVFTDSVSRGIWVSTGSAPTLLATLPGSAAPTYLTFSPSGQIVVGGSDGVIRIYNADGSPADGSFASFGSLGGIEHAPGGAFGTDLHVLDSAAGTLVRVSPAGAKTIIGTGFATGAATKDIAFGPCGNLFVSVHSQNAVRVIAPLGCACNYTSEPDFDGSGSVDGADLGALLGAWGTDDCATDLNRDGIVDGADLGILLAGWGV
ncbi:MAG TPA: hypothetical protein PKC43_08395 [Phycisphaerales bacterium]|nr:hypothetical protein [Phycisphaerales bacterium]HMP37455.1 hypothetical protein [Phycisphaerales bacterium]